MRLGKRERMALKANRQRKAAKVANNAAIAPALAEASRLAPCLNRAYNPKTESLSAGGRGRVMHNAQGSEGRRRGPSKDKPIMDRKPNAGLGS